MDARSFRTVYDTGLEPLTGLTVGGAHDTADGSWNDIDAVVDPLGVRRWSWGELRREARPLAAGSLANGLERGDRIGLPATTRSCRPEAGSLSGPKLVVSLEDGTHPGTLRVADPVAAADAGSPGRVDGIAGTLDPGDPLDTRFASGATGAPTTVTAGVQQPAAQGGSHGHPGTH